jgi:uncharacterized protein YaiL (DUF2058 family)
VSLRDQLVSKGLASKKDAQRINRELKSERRIEQAQRKSKAELEAEEAAKRAEEEQQQLAQRQAERSAREEVRSATERTLRVRSLISDNKLRPGSGQPFWHKGLDGQQLLRMEVSSGIAYQLRCGQAGIAALQRQGWLDYVVIPAATVHRVRELAPEQVVFFVDDVAGISEPENRFLERKWDTSLEPHRAREGDIVRFSTD